jgi:hypothetical protein
MLPMQNNSEANNSGKNPFPSSFSSFSGGHNKKELEKEIWHHPHPDDYIKFDRFRARQKEKRV